MMQNPDSGAGSAPIVISRGAAAGTYQAFPDVCRLRNGDIVAVFYAGYAHVSLPKPPEWPHGGRLCLVRSRDEGRTWSEPAVIYDDPDDNRDPHIAQMPDGSLRCTFFSLRPAAQPNRPAGASPYDSSGVQIIQSHNNGYSWDTQARSLTRAGEHWFCSAPVRVLPSGAWMLGVYKFDPPNDVYGGVLRSTDRGQTWGEPIPIGKGQNLALDAETDVIARKDGTLFAALRCGKPGAHMYYATSGDDGRTWTPAQDIGFPGHAPFLYRLRDETLLLAHRLPNTALHVSRDEARTWQGPFVIDDVPGAYPSLVQLRNGDVLCVYYTEGEGSVVRARRFRVTPGGIEMVPIRVTENGGADPSEVIEARVAQFAAQLREDTKRFHKGTPLPKYPSETVDLLIEALDHEKREVLFRAIMGLGRIGDPRAIPALIDFLDHPENPNRDQATFHLIHYPTPAVVDRLLLALDDPVPGVRSAAMLGLSVFGEPRAVAPFLRAFERVVRGDEPDDDMRWYVVKKTRSLGQKLGDTESFAALREALPGFLDDADPFMRKEAARALAWLNGDPPPMTCRS